MKTITNISNVIHKGVESFTPFGKRYGSRILKMGLNYFLYPALVVLPVIMSQCARSQLITTRQAPDKLFPADSGIINIKAYGAKGDGVTDDTQAIQNAIRENIGKSKTLYFPSGTYLVSNRLEWRKADGTWISFLAFQGQNQANTIIKLKNAASGFTNPASPRAVIYTASNNPYDDTGAGVEAYNNHIQDLTIDTGTANPGAIGIDYMATNNDVIRNVTIRSGDGQGMIGLAFIRKNPGPCLIKYVMIKGFDYGIHSNQTWTGSMTFEHISLNNQKVAGILNEGSPLAIRKLTSTNTVPAIKSTNWMAFTTLIDANLSGGSSSASAIEDLDNSKLYVRNLTTSGYQSAIKNNTTVVPGASKTEYAYPRIDSLFLSPQRSLNLPVAETPTYHDNHLNNWASVVKYGAKPDDGQPDSDAIQKAIDSGKSTIYFPAGSYNLSKPIYIRGNVKKIVGMESTLELHYTHIFRNTANPQAVIRVENTNQDTVFIEGLRLHPGGADVANAYIGIEHASPKKLVLKNVYLAGTFKYAYSNTPGVGLLYADNVAVIGDRNLVKTEAWHFGYPQTVWARQMDTEYRSPGIVNNGGKLWILGFKGEGLTTNVYTKGGGQTEVLGGVAWGSGPSAPAFVNNESQFSTSIFLVSGNKESDYSELVRETHNGVTRSLMKDDAIGLAPATGSVLPFYVGYDVTKTGLTRPSGKSP
jgi:hypothetical protein